MNNIQVRKNLTSDLRSTTSITSRKCLDLMILTYFDAFFMDLHRSLHVKPPLTQVATCVSPSLMCFGNPNPSQFS